MDRQQESAKQQQAVVEKLLEENAQMEEMIQQMQAELDRRNEVEEAAKAEEA